MSVPRTLELPAGVSAVSLETDRGTFAAHVVRADQPVGHVLLVPGWTGSKEDFTPLLPLLAAAGYDATTYDQRGQYETPGLPTDDYTLDGFAADALAVRATADPPRSHLLGHSFGGLVSQHAAVTDPSAWQTLGLLCTGPGALGDTVHRPLRRLAAAIGKVPLLQLHELREQGVKRPAQVTAFLARRFTANAPASLKAMTQLLIDAPDIVEDVTATGLPVWVARGADDDAWPHDVQALMAQRLGTEIHVIPDSAHSPGVENPAGLVEAWQPFLRRHG
ncbi:MAG: alpha/beta hydrolase [Aeromicrobium sp.]|jgi:pimeloyl-ACP methyl ester carboxylesterase|nr:alpha/beta hydrolase [Aeromicrobium sp.]